MNATEQRNTPRVHCFLVDDVRHQLPIWVFRPEDEDGAIVALAVDVNQSGIAVLVDPGAKVGPTCQRIHVLAAPEIGFEGGILDVAFEWQESDSSLFSRVGFSVQPSSADLAALLQSCVENRPEPKRAVWLRCTLLPTA
jgi:hypothetical protein